MRRWLRLRLELAFPRFSGDLGLGKHLRQNCRNLVARHPVRWDRAPITSGPRASAICPATTVWLDPVLIQELTTSPRPACPNCFRAQRRSRLGSVANVRDFNCDVDHGCRQQKQREHLMNQRSRTRRSRSSAAWSSVFPSERPKMDWRWRSSARSRKWSSSAPQTKQNGPPWMRR